MSYCRWSSDDFQCDLYCYGSGDNFITNIASNRVVPKEPLPEDIDWGSEDFVDAYIERWSVVSKLVDDADRVPITLPYAGETFIDKTLEEFKQRIQMLKDIGYRVPDHVFERIDEEIDELSGTNTEKD